MSLAERARAVLVSLNLPVPVFVPRGEDDVGNFTSAREVRADERADVYHLLAHYLCALHADGGDEVADRVAEAIGGIIRDREWMMTRIQTLTNDIEALRCRETWR